MDKFKKYRVIEFILQGFIYLSVLCFSLQTVKSLPLKIHEILTIFERVLLVIFSIEYLVRIVIAKRKWRYIFSFYGIVDLVAILPFFLLHGMDTLAVRILRTLRIFRVLKLFRYYSAIEHIRLAIVSVKEEFVVFGIFSFALLYFTAIGIYYFERQVNPEQFGSIFHCLWWAIITLTTVGYGDTYPVTVGGKVFTFFVLIIGLGIVAFPAGLLANALGEVKQEQFRVEEEPESKNLFLKEKK